MGEQEKKDAQSTHTLSDMVKQARPDEVDQAIEMLRRHWQTPLKEELDERERLLDEKQQQSAELQRGIEAVRKENGDLRAKLHAAEKVRDALELDKGAATRAYEEAADQRDAANERVNELDLALKIANDRIAAVTAEKDGFAKDVADTAEKVTAQETAIEELMERVEAANREAATAIGERIDLEKDLAAHRETVRRVREAVDELARYRGVVVPAEKAGSTHPEIVGEVERSTLKPVADAAAGRPKTRTAPFEVPKDDPGRMPTGRELGIAPEVINPASAAPTQEIPVPAMNPSGWARMKERLDDEIGRYQAIPKRAQSTDKLTAVLVPLLKRYETGERTPELFGAIHRTCR